MKRCLVPSEWHVLWCDYMWPHSMTSWCQITNYGAKGLGNIRCGRCVNAQAFSFGFTFLTCVTESRWLIKGNAGFVTRKSGNLKEISYDFRLINKLLEADGKDHVKFNPDNTSSAFVALENIEQFNNGVKRYGVPDEPVFNKNDLYEGVKGPFYNVINCLNLLGLHVSIQR